jgi:ATP-dependent protease HslVU (ClpYQ) peptidase subunit
MTCIVALAHEGKVYMGADSSAVDNDFISLRKNPKIFKRGKFLFGYAHSFRFGQIVEHHFKPPQVQGKDIYEYMVTKFIPELMDVLEKNNFDEKEVSLIIGYDGNIFYVESDFQIGHDVTNYHAIGSGAPVALGSLYSTEGLCEPKDRVRVSLEAAQSFTTTVREPFNYLIS